MATDGAMQYPDRPPMTVAEIVALTKKELNPEDERHVKVAATGIGALEGQTLDLSHQGISVLPVEVIVLIKDKVERYMLRKGRTGGGGLTHEADSRCRIIHRLPYRRK